MLNYKKLLTTNNFTLIIMNLKGRIKTLIEQCDSKTGKYFEFFIQSLIVISIMSFTIETIPNLSLETISFLNYFEIISIIIFTIEYISRILVIDNKLKFIFSFMVL